MVLSMTGFASITRQGDWGLATWEVRSINHRYLDIHFRIPDSLNECELAWRKKISKKQFRGKIDCQLIYIPGEKFAPKIAVNHPLLSQLIQQTKNLQNLDECFSTQCQPINYLKWPGVIVTEKQDTSVVMPILSEILEEALEDLVAMRQREGSEIQQLIQQRLEDVSTLVEQARECVPNSLVKQREKFELRLQDLAQSNPERVEQELVIFASKWDVAEELDRLVCHTQEVNNQITKRKGPHGRRLDFLMQEMNREANTLASKSQDTQLSNISVDLKVIIEQMREQIQNLE